MLTVCCFKPLGFEGVVNKAAATADAFARKTEAPSSIVSAVGHVAAVVAHDLLTEGEILIENFKDLLHHNGTDTAETQVPSSKKDT